MFDSTDVNASNIHDAHDKIAEALSKVPLCRYMATEHALCLSINCEVATHCHEQLRNITSALMALSSKHFLEEQIVLKHLLHREAFQLHCDEHSQLTDLLVKTIDALHSPARMSEAIGLLKRFQQIFVFHTENRDTLDLEGFLNSP